MSRYASAIRILLVVRRNNVTWSLVDEIGLKVLAEKLIAGAYHVRDQ